MDFWNWLWVLAFPALLIGGWLIITRMGQRALSRYLSEQTPVPTRKSIQEGLKADWDAKFQELLSKRRD